MVGKSSNITYVALGAGFNRAAQTGDGSSGPAAVAPVNFHRALRNIKDRRAAHSKLKAWLSSRETGFARQQDHPAFAVFRL
jgi:hypothetical protein